MLCSHVSWKRKKNSETKEAYVKAIPNLLGLKGALYRSWSAMTLQNTFNVEFTLDDIATASPQLQGHGDHHIMGRETRSYMQCDCVVIKINLRDLAFGQQQSLNCRPCTPYSMLQIPLLVRILSRLLRSSTNFRSSTFLTLHRHSLESRSRPPQRSIH